MKKSIKVQKCQYGEEVTPGDYAMSALSGAASGASAGSAFGGLGAVVGGVIGAGAGLFGLKNKEKALIEEQRRRQYQTNYATARANTQAAMAEYYNNYSTAMTMKNGGEVDYSPVYLNDGETVVHPDGTVKRIPKKGRKTDSVLSMEPVGSFVFGGVVDPDTNETYADMAEKRFKPTKTASSDKYADGTKDANKLIANVMFNKQEQTKAIKGIKPKYKDVDIQAANGGAKVKPNEFFGLNGLKKPDFKLPEFDKNSVNKQSKLSQFASDLASLTPVVYNFSQGTKPAEYEAPQYNLNASSALGQLQNRYNINRVVRDVNNAANAGYYNANVMGNSTGANMLQRVAIANNARRGVEDVYAKYNEIDTNLGAQRAELLNSIGQQDVQARMYTNDVNARNAATRNTYTTSALEGLSKFVQNKRLMNNQQTIDLSILPFLKEYLSHGSTNVYGG